MSPLNWADLREQEDVSEKKAAKDLWPVLQQNMVRRREALAALSACISSPNGAEKAAASSALDAGPESDAAPCDSTGPRNFSTAVASG